jgi:thiopurine S-methyltransferase
MEAEYWQSKWIENKIGFHQSEINKRLISYWPDIAANAVPGKVFVPLCGKSKDMLWLHQQGHSVVGVELSALAAEAFFTENNLSSQRDQIDGFEVFSGRGAAGNADADRFVWFATDDSV